MRWVDIEYFKPDSKIDNWVRPDKINLYALKRVDNLRRFIKYPIYVTSGFRDNKNSEHIHGHAFDIVSPAFTKSKSLLDFYLAAERFGFTGIGLYPDWHYNHMTCGGLHVDRRYGPEARWLGVKSGAGQKYIGLTQANLVKHKVIP